jgi:hypothetical protein
MAETTAKSTLRGYMKRSEMLDEMNCDILAYATNYPQYPLVKIMELATILLDNQERLGMLPPKRESVIEYSEEDGSGSFQEIIYSNDWESEDE